MTLKKGCVGIGDEKRAVGIFVGLLSELRESCVCFLFGQVQIEILYLKSFSFLPV